MEKVLNIFKPVGLTPVQLIEKVRQLHPEYQGAVLSFAGRLDPMASGVMLLLVGEENKNRAAYLELEKEYVFEILFGIETDTFDALGLIRKIGSRSDISKDQLEASLPKYTGEIIQEFPSYSSKPVQGKSLFQWAREERLSEIQIPTAKRNVYSLNVLDSNLISNSELWHKVNTDIAKVNGDFRQEQILKRWHEVLSGEQIMFSLVKMKAVVSSGTYIRTIAHSIGADLGVCGVALHINRTRIGTYKIENSIQI